MFEVYRTQCSPDITSSEAMFETDSSRSVRRAVHSETMQSVRVQLYLLALCHSCLIYPILGGFGVFVIVSHTLVYILQFVGACGT